MKIRTDLFMSLIRHDFIINGCFRNKTFKSIAKFLGTYKLKKIVSYFKLISKKTQTKALFEDNDLHFWLQVLSFSLLL